MNKPFIKNQLFLINRDFQLRYTKAAVGVGILSTVLTAVVVLYPLFVFEILRIPRFLPWPIFATMAIAVVINVSFLAFMGIFITHRIAGPMYSLVKHIRLVGLGKWNVKMKLRDEDEMKFVVRNFNEMTEELRAIGTQDLGLILEIKKELIEQNSSSKIIEKLDFFETRLQKRLTGTEKGIIHD